jgi:hypothetical protein
VNQYPIKQFHFIAVEPGQVFFKQGFIFIIHNLFLSKWAYPNHAHYGHSINLANNYAATFKKADNHNRLPAFFLIFSASRYFVLSVH